MSRRGTSLSNLSGTAIAREIDSKYDVIKEVSNYLVEIEAVATEDLAALTQALNDAKDFTGITVVTGPTASWDSVTKILTVTVEKGDPGPQGATGPAGADGLDGATGPRGQKGDKGDQGIQGTQGPRGYNGPAGPAGPQGPAGQDLTIEQITYNGDGTFTWDFIDGTSYTTPDMRGPKGDEGDQGPKGDTGISVHHLKGTSTTDFEGNFGVPAETDTYTFYGDADETIVLGYFSVTNGTLEAGSGIMAKSVYDTDNNGIVDNSTRLGGKTLATIELERTQAIEQAKLALGTNHVVDDLTDRGFLEDLTVGDKIFVKNDGDGKWAQYLVIGITDGLGSTSTYEKIMDEDIYLNSISAGAVKTAYESNADTNAYTNAEKNKLATIETGATADQTGAEIKALYEGQLNKVLENVTYVDFGDGSGPGTLQWNTDAETLDLTLGDTTTLQLGQELLHLVRNSTATAIPNGTVVMATGALGASGRITVAAHDGTQANAVYILGMTTQDIPAGEDGFVTCRGKVRGLNTTGTTVGEAWADGDVLYLKPNDAGALTKVEPLDTEVRMPVAFVVDAHSTNGTLEVRVNGVDTNGFKPWVQAELDLKADSADVYLKTETYTQAEVDGLLDTKVDLTDYQAMNLDRADKYLANQNVVDMTYNVDGKLVKVQYNNATDVDYEVLGYNVDGKLDNVAHYVGGVLQGNTVLSYSGGKLVSAPFVGV